MYNKKVMDIFIAPKNVGVIRGASGIGKVGNARCGDIMKIFILVEDDVITDVKFQTFGCTAAIASSSIATEMIKGKTVSEAYKLTNAEVLAELGELPRSKIHCSVLAEEAIKMAIDNYRKRLAEGKLPPVKKKVEKPVKEPVKDKAAPAAKVKETTKKEKTAESKAENKPADKVVINAVKETKPKQSKTTVKTDKEKTVKKDNSVKPKTVAAKKQDKKPVKKETIKEEPVKADTMESLLNDIKQSISKNPSGLTVDSEEFKTTGSVTRSDNDTGLKYVPSFIINRDELKGKIKENSVKSEDEQMSDDIDNITAKLSEAISKLNFKFDTSDDNE